MDCESNTEVTLTQRDTLPNTNDTSTCQEKGNVVSRSKRLHECGNNNQHTTNTHSNLAAQEVGTGATKEETSKDGADRVRRINGANCVCVWFVHPCYPVLGPLDGIEDRCIVTVKHHA